MYFSRHASFSTLVKAAMGKGAYFGVSGQQIMGLRLVCGKRCQDPFAAACVPSRFLIRPENGSRDLCLPSRTHGLTQFAEVEGRCRADSESELSRHG
jgi:hypothetical protein